MNPIIFEVHNVKNSIWNENENAETNKVSKFCNHGSFRNSRIKTMESVMVKYNGTVRNSVSQLTKLRYGENDPCGETVQLQSLPTIKLSHKTFEKRLKFDISNERYLRRICKEDLVNELTESTVIFGLEGWGEHLTRDREALR